MKCQGEFHASSLEIIVLGVLSHRTSHNMLETSLVLLQNVHTTVTGFSILIVTEISRESEHC